MNPFSCKTCRRYGGLFVVGGTHKVKCKPRGLREIPLPGTCPGWVGEDLLEGYSIPAAPPVVKKWG